MCQSFGVSRLHTTLATDASLFRSETLRYAYRCGLRDMEAEDCASAFVCYAADLFQRQPAQYERLHQPAYLHQCVKNHTRRWSQKLQREREQETHYATQNTYVATNAPLSSILSTEFIAVLERVMQAAPSDGQEAFWQLQAGESVEMIAQSQGKSTNAVRLTLTRLRRRLCASLSRCGWEQCHCEEMLATLLQTITERNFCMEEKYPT
jgi:DNA-directed RNA polymerase specialized sigma24 family protein